MTILIGVRSSWDTFDKKTLTEFFFFGVHETSLFDIPAMACILILALFTLNKKWILYSAC